MSFLWTVSWEVKMSSLLQLNNKNLTKHQHMVYICVIFHCYIQIFNTDLKPETACYDLCFPWVQFRYNWARFFPQFLEKKKTSEKAIIHQLINLPAKFIFCSYTSLGSGFLLAAGWTLIQVLRLNCLERSATAGPAHHSVTTLDFIKQAWRLTCGCLQNLHSI